MNSERIEPFRALYYNLRRAGDLAALVAPPYDLIDPERQRELYERSPYNVVRLELGREQDRYAAAARTLEQWMRERILERSPAPAIYFYTQRFEIEGATRTREGLFARVRLEEFSRGAILPHERTFAGPKQDRLRLLDATRTNLSPVFALYSGSHPELERLSEQVRRQPPMLEVTDDRGIANQLRPIEEPGRIAIVKRALAGARILIADGHHRYETALNYRRQRRAARHDPAAVQPYDYVMMTLVGCGDPGLVILPTHRVVKRLKPGAVARLTERAGELFEIEECADRAALRARLRAAAKGALGVALKGDPKLRLLRLKTGLAMADALPHLPAEIRELDVTLLHGLLFDRVLMVGDDEVRAGGNLEYTIDAEAALDAVAAGSADGAFLTNPPSVADVERVSAAGATMPEKSTYFYPKLLTGLVMNPLSA